MATRTGPLSSRRAALFVSLVLAADVAVAAATQNAAASTPAIDLDFRPRPVEKVDPKNEALLAEAIERTKREPSNPEAHYTVATYYWEKAYRDFTTPEPDKMKFVQQGLQAIDQAIKLNPNYFEALTYKNLLLRVQANLEKNPARQQALLREANEFRDKAQEIRKKAQAAGAR